MGSGYSKMKKQARQLSLQMEKAREDLQKKVVTGESGNGLVKVHLNGEKVLQSIQISPDCIDKNDVEGLQDLIVAAFEKAYEQIEDTPGTSAMPFGF